MSGPRLSALYPFRRLSAHLADPFDGFDAAMRDVLEAAALSLVTLCDDGLVRAQGKPLTPLSRVAMDALVARGLLVAVDDTSVKATRAGYELARVSRRRRKRFAQFLSRKARGAA